MFILHALNFVVFYSFWCRVLTVAFESPTSWHEVICYITALSVSDFHATSAIWLEIKKLHTSICLCFFRLKASCVALECCVHYVIKVNVIIPLVCYSMFDTPNFKYIQFF